jgi:hypothetical protein
MGTGWAGPRARRTLDRLFWHRTSWAHLKKEVRSQDTAWGTGRTERSGGRAVGPSAARLVCTPYCRTAVRRRRVAALHDRLDHMGDSARSPRTAARNVLCHRPAVTAAYLVGGAWRLPAHVPVRACAVPSAATGTISPDLWGRPRAPDIATGAPISAAEHRPSRRLDRTRSGPPKRPSARAASAVPTA